MSFIISLPAELEDLIRRRAAAAGKAPDDYVAELVRGAATAPSLAEILAPVHREVRDSGAGEEELNTLLQSAVDASRRDRRRASIAD